MKYIIRDPANGGSSNNESRQKEAEIKIGKFVYDDDKKFYHETPNKTGMRCDAAMPFFPSLVLSLVKFAKVSVFYDET